MLGLEMLTQNFDDGYSEACVRALSKSFLTKEKYEELVQAASIEELKVLLEDTDYSKYIVTLSDEGLNEIHLKRKMQEKLRDEIEYFMANATQPLGGFLEMMLHSYQINNVVSLMASKKGQAGANQNAQAASMNPLGMFHGFSTVQKLAQEEDMVTLFQEILIDLPVGEYFRKFLDQVIMSTQEGDGNVEGVDMQQVSEKIAATSNSDLILRIKKIWLGEYHRWIQANCNAATAEHMDAILKAEADWELLQINFNSLTRKNGEERSAADKEMLKNLQPNLGHLYPAHSENIARSKDYNEFVANLTSSPYHQYFTKISEPNGNNEAFDGELTIDDYQMRDLSKRYSVAFFGQFHYGVFYAYLKLKELEIANITHLASLLAVKQIAKNHPAFKKWVPPFQWSAEEEM